MPDVRNQNQATAEPLLAGAGLTPSVIYQPVTDPSMDGIVIDQNPAPGADAKSGEVVIITVGQLQNGGTGRQRHDDDHHDRAVTPVFA